MKKSIKFREIELISLKIVNHLLFNETCLNNNLLPTYTNVHIYIPHWINIIQFRLNPTRFTNLILRVYSEKKSAETNSFKPARTFSVNWHNWHLHRYFEWNRLTIPCGNALIHQDCKDQAKRVALGTEFPKYRNLYIIYNNQPWIPLVQTKLGFGDRFVTKQNSVWCQIHRKYTTTIQNLVWFNKIQKRFHHV